MRPPWWLRISLALLVASPALAQSLAVGGDVRGTHDPAIAVDGGKYFVFATGAAYAVRAGEAPPEPGQPRPAPVGQLPVRCSADLLVWTRCGAVFPAVPDWIAATSPKTHDLWAPDVSYFHGEFHLYYAFSVFGKNTSGIALATSPSLDSATARWTDRGLVLRSEVGDDFNAIDPNVTLDEKGDPWMAFGSFWSGIKLRRLDRETGLPSARDTRLYALAARARTTAPETHAPGMPPDTRAIEAPFLFRHGDFYYLFVSWDLCCRSAASTYRTMVGRARTITGPYLDRTGKPMHEGGGTPVLRANAKWAGPGGASLLHLPGRDVIAFHAYSADNGRPSLLLSNVSWVDGWPVVVMDGDPAAGADAAHTP